jgi:uncharacterized protein (TIGR00369 family)
MLDPDRLKRIQARASAAPCIGALGLILLEAEPGFCRLSARHDPRFDGVLPGFHGGMLANVADCAAWFAIVTHIGPEETLVTSDLHIRYLAPCVGDALVEARVIKLGRTLCPVAVNLFDTAGMHVAAGTVTYIRVDNLGKS